MPKLAPAPAQPIDMVTAERRQESQVLPQASPFEARGPVTDRLDERRSILQRVTAKLDNTPPSIQPQPPRLHTPVIPQQTPTARTTTEERRNVSPLTAMPPPETATQTEQKAPSLLTSLKNTFLNVVGLGDPTPKSAQEVGQPGDEKPGLFARIAAQFTKIGEVTTLSSLASWTKGLVCAAFPKLSLWLKPTAPTRATTLPLREQRSSVSTEKSLVHHNATAVLTPRSDNEIIWRSPTRQVDHTAKGLETFAAAKREQIAQDEKKKDTQDVLRQREKAKLRASLSKLVTEGVDKGDMSAIIAEFEGVYGSAEVALRQANELAHKKKLR